MFFLIYRSALTRKNGASAKGGAGTGTVQKKCTAAHWSTGRQIVLMLFPLKSFKERFSYSAFSPSSSNKLDI